MVLIKHDNDTLIIYKKLGVEKHRDSKFRLGVLENANGQLFSCKWKIEKQIDWEHPVEIKRYRKKGCEN